MGRRLILQLTADIIPQLVSFYLILNEIFLDYHIWALTKRSASRAHLEEALIHTYTIKLKNETLF